MNKWKDNVYFVLVEPKEPGNIGASARAMKNMGFRNLCLVRPPGVMTDEAKWLACNALDVLDAAKRYDTVGEAIRDKSLVVGTTRRAGRKRGMILPVEKGAERMHAVAARNRIALLFGREARGLFNEEVDECGFLLTIPSSRMQPSLNLSHAVLLVAYELSKAEYRAGESTASSPALVSHAEQTALFDRLSGVLSLLEYLPRGNMDLRRKIMRNLKHFMGRAGLTGWELNMLYGICSQIEKKIGRK